MNNPYGTAICPICGKEFIKTKYNSLLCSDDCKRINENRRRAGLRKINLPVVKCVVCGKEFKQSHGSQKCCSPECAKVNHNNSNKEYRRLAKSNSAKSDPVNCRKKSKKPKSKETIDKFQEVIDAQRGPVEELYAKSRKWTKEQIAFAKERYRKIYLAQ